MDAFEIAEYLRQPISEEWLLRIGARYTDHKPDYRTREWYRQLMLTLPGHRYMKFTCWHYKKGKDSPVDVVAATYTYHSGMDFFPWPQINNRGMLLRILEILETRRTVEEWIELAENEQQP